MAGVEVEPFGSGDRSRDKRSRFHGGARHVDDDVVQHNRKRAPAPVPVEFGRPQRSRLSATDPTTTKFLPPNSLRM
jgi:hypothetical protein